MFKINKIKRMEITLYSKFKQYCDRLVNKSALSNDYPIYDNVLQWYNSLARGDQHGNYELYKFL